MEAIARGSLGSCSKNSRISKSVSSYRRPQRSTSSRAVQYLGNGGYGVGFEQSEFERFHGDEIEVAVDVS
eukprot:scaffold203146_cov23-Cyclotella_meneghiniana.AAC.2